MSYQITLDAGTTNTRATLWRDRKELVAQCKTEVGAGATAADGNNRRLVQAVKYCIGHLVSGAGIGNVECVLASGMVTSNLGLWEVPHLTAPVGLRDFAAGIEAVELYDVGPAPFLFIPGMKNCVEPPGGGFEAMDMMRGEEVEALALMAELPLNEPCLLALPGSHTKFVSVYGGRLTGCLTTIGGELLNAITTQTVIADAVGGKFASENNYNSEMVLLGCRTSKRLGLTRAAFSARILEVQLGRSREDLASYLLGAVLAQDVLALKNSQAVQAREDMPVIVGGKGVLCRGLADALRESGFRRVTPASGDAHLAAKGALAVYEEYIHIKKAHD